VATRQGEEALQLAAAEVLEDRQEEDRVGLDGPSLGAVDVFRRRLDAVDAELQPADDLVALGRRRDVRRDDEANLDRRAAFRGEVEGFELRPLAAVGGAGGLGGASSVNLIVPSLAARAR